MTPRSSWGGVRPNLLHASVLYALGEMRHGFVVRAMTLDYSPRTGWVLR
jgi:hypothetical protein